MVGLHRRRQIEAKLRVGVEELLDAAGAEGLFPIAAVFGRLVGADDRVVGVEDEPGGGIVELRRLVEGHHAGPVERARCAVDRGEPVARLAGRQQAGADEADVAVDVGVGEILGRRLIGLKRVEELVPVARDVGAHQRFGGRVAVA